jgi:N-acetyl-1-D-myo-inositol-2-amino-2-deoxy-alpha-D-glucopyranoside deacetylase
MPETPRLLFVHAHPDDESLANGATIAHYTARGADVRVVTCTLGEEGEVIGDRWAGLAVGRADQLGGYRIGELTAALRALGVCAPVYLGGAGRWRDSGMEGTPKRGRQRFIDADEREAVGALVAIIREQRPHVVVTYDPNGGYGHPDHIRAHEITMAATAAVPDVDRVFYAVTSRRATDEGVAKLAGVAGLPFRLPEPDELPVVDDAEISTAGITMAESVPRAAVMSAPAGFTASPPARRTRRRARSRSPARTPPRRRTDSRPHRRAARRGTARSPRREPGSRCPRRASARTPSATSR